jgi:hypothetical protein
MTVTPDQHRASSSDSWLNSYRGLSDERILTLMDMLAAFKTDMSSNLSHVVQVAEERGLLTRYGGMMPNDRLETALRYVRGPERLAWLQALARKRGLPPISFSTSETESDHA